MEIRIRDILAIVILVAAGILVFRNRDMISKNEAITKMYDSAITVNKLYQIDSIENAKLQIEKDRVIDSLERSKSKIIKDNHEIIREIYLVTDVDYIDSILSAKYDSAYTFRFSSIIKKADSLGYFTKLGRSGPVTKSR